MSCQYNDYRKNDVAVEWKPLMSKTFTLQDTLKRTIDPHVVII